MAWHFVNIITRVLGIIASNIKRVWVQIQI